MSSTRSPLDGPPAPKTRMGRLNSVCRAAWNPDRKSYPRVLAEREGVKGPTLRSRAHRALTRLRERLRRRMPELMPESSST